MAKLENVQNASHNKYTNFYPKTNTLNFGRKIKPILSLFECFTASKGSNIYILIAITTAGAMS